MKCPYCEKEISVDDIMPVIISTGEEFEQFLCDKINSHDGMACEKTKASGDQGVDLIVRVADKKIAIQCKLYSEPVGNSAVQEVVSGRIMYKCDIGCVVTNNSFTTSARELAAAAEVVLLNYCDLLQYLDSVKSGTKVDVLDQMIADMDGEDDIKAIGSILLTKLYSAIRSKDVSTDCIVDCVEKFLRATITSVVDVALKSEDVTLPDCCFELMALASSERANEQIRQLSSLSPWWLRLAASCCKRIGEKRAYLTVMEQLSEADESSHSGLANCGEDFSGYEVLSEDSTDFDRIRLYNKLAMCRTKVSLTSAVESLKVVLKEDDYKELVNCLSDDSKGDVDETRH